MTTNERLGFFLILSLLVGSFASSLTLSLSHALSQPVDFAMLWSSCASRPSGYLDIAWSQSPVNQISSDLAGPADKTLHGKRKWQTAGDTRPDYEGSVKRDWSQRLFKLKKAAKNENILLVSFLFFQFTLTESDLDLIGKCWKKEKKSQQGVTSFLSQKDEWKRERFQEWMMLCRFLCASYML